MSFKIKKWALWRTVDLLQRMPGAFKVDGNQYTWAYPWQDRVICMVYAADGKPVWLLYDPSGDSFDGPFPGPPSGWGWYSYFYGMSVNYGYWGTQYFMGTPGGAMGYGAPNLFTWDTAFNFWYCTWDFGQLNGKDRYLVYPSTGIGTDGSGPTFMVYSATSWWDPPYYTEWGMVEAGGGYTPLKTLSNADPESFYIPFYDGSNYCLRKLGAYYAGEIINVVDGGADGHPCLHSAIPLRSDHFVEAWGSFGGGLLCADPMGMTFGPCVGGEPILQVWMEDEFRNPGAQGWAPATNPLSLGERPYQSRWDYYHQLSGVPIDELDLDGSEHMHSYNPMAGKTMSMGSNGWYMGIPSNTSGYNFEVYVLDPWQHGGVSPGGSARADGVLGWMGDYALTTEKKLQHIQPFPEDRAPQGGGVMPPQERTDGLLLGRKEIFQGGGTRYRYLRDVSIDLSAYPHTEDWWFPGEVGTRYPGLWAMFAGSNPTLVGYMPDPEFGMISPEGQPCMRLLGVPGENLRAASFSPTFTLSDGDVVQNAPWAVPQAPNGIFGPRNQLVASLDGKTFVWTSNGLRMAEEPYWKAIVGKLNGRNWETIIDFADLTPPELGQSGWTIWSVVPISKNRSLPHGGYLVGATLYFAPWADGEWEERPGTRDATFVGSGKGWVPAKLGWDGPLNNDEHAPVYLTALDEWTVGRSLYGPDALLVFDDQGRYVSYLNSYDMWPPDGREIMLTSEASPKLVFRIYRHGTYSDFGEYTGQFVETGGNSEVQAPLYAVYEFLSPTGIQPGAGAFLGFVNMAEVAKYSTNDHVWRWGVAETLYAWDDPKNLWAPPGGTYVRSGRGGGGLTPLTPGPSKNQSGIKGTARNAKP